MDFISVRKACLILNPGFVFVSYFGLTGEQVPLKKFDLYISFGKFKICKVPGLRSSIHKIKKSTRNMQGRRKVENPEGGGLAVLGIMCPPWLR